MSDKHELWSIDFWAADRAGAEEVLDLLERSEPARDPMLIDRTSFLTLNLDEWTLDELYTALSGSDRQSIRTVDSLMEAIESWRADKESRLGK